VSSSAFGLCAACAHQRVVGNTRGSTFSLCGLSRVDDRFPRYPRMPVGACPGFRRRADEPEGGTRRADAPGGATRRETTDQPGAGPTGTAHETRQDDR
jgi:hypothetical protein